MRMETQFIKIIDGKASIKSRKNIIIHKNTLIENPETGEMVECHEESYNPTDEMLFEDGWELYVEPEPTEEELKRKALNTKLIEIKNYDASSEVNVFYIQEIPVWLDKATRAGLKLRFEAEAALGKEETTLWYENQSFTLPLNSAVHMLYALEVYASECYDNTQLHLSNIDKLETLEEIAEYNYKVGYPEKLYF